MIILHLHNNDNLLQGLFFAVTELTKNSKIEGTQSRGQRNRKLERSHPPERAFRGRLRSESMRQFSMIASA